MSTRTIRALGVDAGVHTAFAVIDVAVPQGTASFVQCGMLDRADRIAALDRVLNDEPFLEMVAVEVPAGVVFQRERGGRLTRPAMTANLVEATGIGRELRGYAMGLGFEVALATAVEVRAGLCGRHNADDAAVERMLRLRCRNWPGPRKTNDHERDAAAVALFAALRPGRPRECLWKPHNARAASRTASLASPDGKDRTR
jgi:hypothetical protein